jgi:hypothetical protein
MVKANKIIVLLGVIIIGFFMIKAVQIPNNVETAKTQVLSETKKNVAELYEIKALKIPNYLSFAGERVPLEDKDVYERMDRELLVNTYWQSNGLLYLKRANKYFPTIEKILAENGVPDDFKYLALIESGLLNVTSSAGAKGVWQILKGTGREYGLEINGNVDERYHLEKSTLLACKYLNKQYKKFNSWTMAAASYNGGRAGMLRRMNKQKVTNFYDLLLGEETSRYIFRIVAAKEIIGNPQKYGFVFDQEDLYNLKPTYTVKVDSVITNIANFANHYDLTYKEFKILNPWLRENKLNNVSHTEYDIKLPL